MRRRSSGPALASLAVLATLVTQVSSVRADPPGAAAIWRFDDGAATVTDSSGNGNTGTFVGSLGYSSTPPLPLAAGDVAYLKLNGGAAHVTLPNSASLTIPGSFTASAWVRVDSGNTGLILSKDTTNFTTNYNLWV